MEFKKKAGLALALAAIFTTGGANMALANDNATQEPGQDQIVEVNDPTTPITGNDEVTIDYAVDSNTGKTSTVTGTVTVNENVSFAPEMADAIVPVSGTIDVKGTSDTLEVPFQEIQLTAVAN